MEWAWLDYLCLHHEFYDNKYFLWHFQLWYTGICVCSRPCYVFVCIWVWYVNNVCSMTICIRTTCPQSISVLVVSCHQKQYKFLQYQLYCYSIAQLYGNKIKPLFLTILFISCLNVFNIFFIVKLYCVNFIRISLVIWALELNNQIHVTINLNLMFV
jgi:hypothetical protein